MKMRSEAEIKAFAEKLWGKHSVEIATWIDVVPKVQIKVKDRGLHFADLVELSAFFETRNIGESSYDNGAGCPTCGHGRDVGIELMIGPDPQ